jgi:imidazolonepropionase-like amidohydrolase
LISCTGDEPLVNQVLSVAEGRIVGITPRDEWSGEERGEVIDLGRYTVMPGMVDCHEHLCLDMGDEAEQAAHSDAWLTIVSTVNARRILEAGITTMRDVGEKNFIDVQMKRAIEQGVLPGPRLLISGWRGRHAPRGPRAAQAGR